MRTIQHPRAGVLAAGIAVALLAGASGRERAADALVRPGAEFTTVDSLNMDDEPREDARECLAGLRWSPGAFDVRCEPAEQRRGDLLVRFPSPVDTGDERNDRVAMEWYMARDDSGTPTRARAVVVVHESGRNMSVGRMIARGLRAQGLHAFLIQLPSYGARRGPEKPSVDDLATILRQAMADVRRARDAVAALPLVDSEVVGLQGTSLGGFVAATVAGLDHGYDRVFILLAGGNLHEVIENGARDVAKLRRQLTEAGLEGEKLRALVRTVEPLRLAHRIDPRRTWLYSGKFDDVVPPASSHALAQAAGLPAEHHVELSANHYSGIVLLPHVLLAIRERMVDDTD